MGCGKGHVKRGEMMKSLVSHLEEYGLDPVSDEVLLMSFKIHLGCVENEFQQTDTRSNGQERDRKTYYLDSLSLVTGLV